MSVINLVSEDPAALHLALVLGSPAHDYVGSSAYAGPTNCGQGSLVFVNTSCTQVVPPDACPGTPALKACCHTPATSIELDRWNVTVHAISPP